MISAFWELILCILFHPYILTVHIFEAIWGFICFQETFERSNASERHWISSPRNWNVPEAVWARKYSTFLFILAISLKTRRAGVHATIKFSPGTMKWKHILHLILTGWEKWWFSQSSLYDPEVKVNRASPGRANLSVTLELLTEPGVPGLKGVLGHPALFFSYPILETPLQQQQKILASIGSKLVVIWHLL